ncbi:hypothetical protein J5N97_002997 [Dioscorea zingiberensis]|uniref:Pentatricopeptide repeat-containing protein n=1 Tax=Dioscorea zingiberensis TaxID=325984 RepID=A0A9D5D3T8_9LILI|nr:hypothetical protein J5N97_002997 [Dioscorea zingiberensis]
MQIFTWMESLATFKITTLDHASRIDLITKVQSVAEAEMYFEKIPDSASRKAACFPLLHYYVKERDLEKAEALMAKLQSSGLLVNPHLFNEMMKLYMATGHVEKWQTQITKTWEILMEGWVRNKQMDKAVEAMKKGFSLLKLCEWMPAEEIVMAIMGYFEEQGRLEDAKKYVKVLQRVWRLMSLPVVQVIPKIAYTIWKCCP